MPWLEPIILTSTRDTRSRRTILILKWRGTWSGVRETYELEPFDDHDTGVDSRRLFKEQREFKDSRDSLGLQLADILATTLRRAI